MEGYKEQIKAYIKQLSQMGYYSFQIDRIIEDAMGTCKLNKLSPEQTLKLMEILAEHIQFAVKCRRCN